MTRTTLEDDVKDIRDALAAKPTRGPYRVAVDEHPFKTATGCGFHIERRIFTTWEHPQLKGPMGIVNMAVGLGVERPRHFVAMDEADANFLAACYPERIARLLAHIDAQAVRLDAAQRKHAELVAVLVPVVEIIRNLDDKGPRGEGWQSWQLETGIKAIDAAIASEAGK